MTGDYQCIQCDGPSCSKTNPPNQCSRCRSVFYCGIECQKRHWSLHKKECVSFRDESIKLLTPRPVRRVPEPAGGDAACGICKKDPASDPIILGDCNHVFCFSCLKGAQARDSGDNDNDGRDITKCPVCHRVVIGDVEELVQNRASLHAENAALRDVSNSDKRAYLDTAIREVDKVVVHLRDYAAKHWIKAPKAISNALLRKTELLLEAGKPGEALPTLELFVNQFADEELKVQQALLGAARERNDERAIQDLTALTEKLQQGQVDFSIFSPSQTESLDRLLRYQLLKGRALRDAKDWSSALKEYDRVQKSNVLARSAMVMNSSRKVQLLSGLAHSYRETGQLDKALDAARGAIKTDRRAAGVHEPLALAQKAAGDFDGARKTMNVALLHEEPWNDDNRARNVEVLEDLSRAQRELEELRKREEAFDQLWHRLLTVVGGEKKTDQLLTSWQQIKQTRFDILTAYDEELQRGSTVERLEMAVAAALDLEDDDGSDDEFFDAKEPSESFDVEQIKPVAAVSAAAGDRDDDYYSSDDDDENDLAAGGFSGATVTVAEFERIKLTKEVLKWIKRSDSKFKGFFVRRITQLASGDRSRILAKNLTGCKTTIYETYLEQKSGQRILWTEDDKKGLLVWYVSPHKKVSTYIKLIDDAEYRSRRQLTSASALNDFVIPEEPPAEGDGEEMDRKLPADRILLDPQGHSPLKLHEVLYEDIQKLRSDTWVPPLFLTPEERAVVEKRGTVLLLGRSGTGKTVCICNRISYDRHMADVPPKQLFVARSQRICKYVEQTVGGEYVAEGETETQVQHTFYTTFSKLLKNSESKLSDVRVENARPVDDEVNYVSFHRFKEFSFVKESAMDALIIWTQIRSFIKGSIEAAKANRPLTKEEYLGLGARRCRLDTEHREVAYAIYEHYESLTKEEGLWDACDRMSLLLSKFAAADHTIREELVQDKVYVDEIQDYTQAEIALFFKLSRHGGLFFAGDPAQSVVEGVDFRFDEVRSVAHHLFDDENVRKLYMPQKPEIVNVNFRSHAGVLNVASGILDRLFSVFPNAATELKKDRGLFLGPRPGLFQEVNESTLKELVWKIEGVVLLTMHDDDVARLVELVGSEIVVLSIRDSKGLEFPDVILVDFFKGLQKEHQKPWRNLLLGRLEEDIKPEVETHLKQLYTAVTRCSQRLFFAETETSDAGQAFSRWATGTVRRTSREREDDGADDDEKGKKLVVKQNVQDVEKMVKTADEWNSTGVDYAIHGENAGTFERAIFWLEKAVYCCRQGEDDLLVVKLLIHMESIRFREKLESYRRSGEEFDDDKLQHDAAELLGKIAEHGLLMEAARVCKSLIPLLEPFAADRLRQKVMPTLHEFDEED